MLILIFGPTGAGKTEIIRRLEAGVGLRYIRPDVTRALRDGEADKRAVTEVEFARARSSGEYIWVNHLFGIDYGTPRGPVLEAVRDPSPSHLLDFPLERMEELEECEGHKVGIAILPPSNEVLCERLRRAGREDRIAAALEQMEYYKTRLGSKGTPLVGDRVVVNAELERAFGAVRGIISDLARRS